MANRNKAKQMAAAGSSAKEIRQTTGVTGQAARNIVGRAAPTSAATQNLKIAQDVIANPGNYDPGYSREVASQNPSSVIYQGLYGGGLSDGEGGTYKMQGYYVPGATTGIGPNKDVLFAAGPNANQEWMNANFGPGGRYYGGGSSGAASSGTEAAAPGAAAQQAMTKDQKFSAMKGADNYRQALKIAAMNDSTISAKEANAINRQFEVSPDKMVNRLDSINSRQGRKKGLIGLGTSFTNQFADNKLRGQESGFDRMLAGPGGYLSQALSGMNDRTTSNGVNQGGTTTTKGFGKTPKGVSIYGFANSGPLYRQTKGTGGWNYSPKAKGTATTETTTTPVNTGTGTGTTSTTGTTDGPMTPQDMAAASTVSDGQLGGISADLANWASGFKRKGSSRSRGPAGARTLGGATRVAPTTNVLGM